MGKILVVDDEKKIQELITKVLVGMHQIVFTADNGKEALKVIKKQKPDVVLLDLKLPDIDGHRLLGKIRDVNKSIIIVVITAYGTMKSVTETMRQGAYDYIAKPFHIDKIRKVIGSALEKKKPLKKLSKQKDTLEKKCRKIIKENRILPEK